MRLFSRRDRQQRRYEAKLPPFIHPVHAWSAGACGTVRSPLTWFRCKTCGDPRLGNPYADPEPGCLMCRADGKWEGWEVADAGAAHEATVWACDGKPDLIARVSERP